jgi:hypothetical protein
LGGNIPLVYTAVAGANQYVSSGRIKAIAVSSSKRSPSMPDVPTFIESGVKEFVIDDWVGLLAPAKTPKPIMAKLNQALNDDVNDNILICEDDFVIKDMTYCNKMLELFFDNFENDKWDVIMLGQNTIDSKDTGIETDNHEKIIKILNSQTTSGYLVKKEYIPRLLKIYENDMNNYVKTGKWGNYYVDQSWKVLQKTDNWYSFYPPVGIQSVSLSDIETGLPKIGLE